MKNRLFISLLPLETERLIIRKTSIEDIELLLKMDKQKETQKFLGGIKNKSREDRLAFLKKREKKFTKGKASSLTVCLKDGTQIGFTQLDIDENNNSACIRFIYDLDYCNKGYCTEACKKLLEIGFKKLELNRIYAETIDGNISSERVLEKLGFQLECVRRKAAYMKNVNEYKNMLDYSILSSEYENQKYDKHGKTALALSFVSIIVVLLAFAISGGSFSSNDRGIIWLFVVGYYIFLGIPILIASIILGSKGLKSNNPEPAYLSFVVNVAKVIFYVLWLY